MSAGFDRFIQHERSLSKLTYSDNAVLNSQRLVLECVDCGHKLNPIVFASSTSIKP
jgi:hypothetical protein